MLGPSVRALGEQFFTKYHVVAPTERSVYFRDMVETEVKDLLEARGAFRQTIRRGGSTGATAVRTGTARSGNRDLSWY